MKFECTRCGACCRRAGLMGLMPQREDGACINLAEDNTCKIYETRPLECNMERMYLRRKKQLKCTKEEYFNLNNDICNQWIKEDGLDEKYLINIKKR